jgi:hypothetical protein
VTKVQAIQDRLPLGWKARNAIEKGAYKQYSAKDMEGLPVGVQIVGRRMEEEKVLEGMKRVQKALSDHGIEYSLLEFNEGTDYKTLEG